MIVSGARIEVDVGHALFECCKERIEIEGRKHLRPAVVVELMTVALLHFGLDEK